MAEIPAAVSLKLGAATLNGDSLLATLSEHRGRLSWAQYSPITRTRIEHLAGGRFCFGRL